MERLTMYVLYPEHLQEVREAISYYETPEQSNREYELELVVLRQLESILSENNICHIDEEIYNIFKMNRKEISTKPKEESIKDLSLQIDKALDQKDKEAFYKLSTLYVNLKKQL
jgi:uncharacterized protein YpiB (UPF0302 family)